MSVPVRKLGPSSTDRDLLYQAGNDASAVSNYQFPQRFQASFIWTTVQPGPCLTFANMIVKRDRILPVKRAFSPTATRRRDRRKGRPRRAPCPRPPSRPIRSGRRSSACLQNRRSRILPRDHLHGLHYQKERTAGSLSRE